jgi:geranylgeranyl pyrophosphate synthase
VKAIAVLSGTGAEAVEAAFQYGRNIGIAFQLVDDLLDFTSSADQLGVFHCQQDIFKLI